MQLTSAHISLDRPPADKIAAIAQAAAMLVDNGCVEDPFRYGIIAREAMGNTYLGHGIAVPHGVPQTERHILKNGIAFVRAEKAGIPWGPQAERVSIIIAVAARGQDYLNILRRITRLMNNPAHLARLRESEDSAEIIALFEQAARETKSGDAAIAPRHAENSVFRKGVVYPHAPGLHLHPANTLSELAKNLDADVHIHTGDGQSASAANVSELLALCITQGQAITVSANQREALETVVAHIHQESEPPEQELLPPVQPPASPRPGKALWYIAAFIALACLAYWFTR